MSNPEQHPSAVICKSEDQGNRIPAPNGQLLEAREVPLGGPRAMLVRRTLPQRARSLIGAWCFIDHYGPAEVSASGGMKVEGHPHTGLQTVSWLFSGEIEHRDSIGTHAMVRPVQMNLMTAGHGIAHSEYSTEATTVLHGAQLWVALPARTRDCEPAFEHYEPPLRELDGAQVRVFLGSLLGETAPVQMHTPLVGAETVLPQGGLLSVPVDPEHEHGVLVDTGVVVAAGTSASSGQLVYQETGHDRLTLEAVGDEPVQVLLLGGAPLGEQILIWWNFVARTQEEVHAFRHAWEAERSGSLEPDAQPRYGELPEGWSTTLPAPDLPASITLRPRG